MLELVCAFVLVKVENLRIIEKTLMVLKMGVLPSRHIRP